MSEHIKILFLTLLAFFVFHNQSSAKTTDADIVTIYKQLKNITYDETRVLKLDSVALKKDRGNILFIKGNIYFSRPVFGRTTHAVFIGEGEFTLTPPNEIEKFQVQRFLKADSVYQQFSAAYFQFTDKTFEPFFKHTGFREANIPGHVNAITEKVNDLFLKERGINLAGHVLADIQNKATGHFISIFERRERISNFPNYLIYSYNAGSREAVAVHEFFPHRVLKDFHTICSFPAIEAEKITAPIRTSHFDVTHYIMDVEVEKNGEMNARAEMTIKSAADSLCILFFEIFDELEIDSVKNESKSLKFIKEEDESGFNVLLPQHTRENTMQKITVFFKGEALERIQNKYTLKNQLYWYPRKGYLRLATYNLTFTYPKDMDVVATGEKIKEWENDGKKKAVWRENIPSIGAAFAFGRFKSDSFTFMGKQKVTVFSEKNRSKRVRESVANDVAGSLYFFEKYLGALPFDHILVTENGSPASYGYRRTLLLTNLSFEHDIEGTMQALRGHETSHQWWGNMIGWKTYHDQWLSESLAEYSGALVIQFLLKDNKYFWDLIDGWRNDFLHRGHIGVSLGMRRFGFSRTDLIMSEGLEAGPIWLGHRLGTKNSVDYYLNVYEKGAMVIHMLRTMLHDFETNNDERFLQMLRDFAQTHKGRKVTTEDFQTTVNKHFDQNMDWFFRQWIYGNQLPTYEYTRRITESDAEFYIEIEVEQKNVPPQFKAYIPIGVTFGSVKKQTHVLRMDGFFKVFRFGPFSQKPDDIIFNDGFGVLAYTKKK